MEHIDENLIAKYLDGSTSIQENNDIELWLEESEENRQMFEEIRSLWLKSRDIRVDETVSFDRVAAWNKVKPSADIKEQRSQWSIWMPRVAASLIVILVGFIAYLYLQENPLPEVFTASDENKEFTLPDGSKVFMEVGATIKYFEDFAEYRNLEFSGLAYFEVVSSTESPFIINTPDLVIKVVGTEFYVNTHQEDYGVGVTSGIVTVKDKHGSEMFELIKDQMIAYDAIGKTFGPLKNLNMNQLYFKSGTLEFTETPLGEVILTLEESFGVDIEYLDSEDSPCLFSGRFNKASLNDILDQLELSLNLEIKRDETITIVSSKCTQ